MRSQQIASARQVFLRRSESEQDQVRQERSFFHSVCLRNGTHKTTAPARLVEVDEIVCETLQGRSAVSLLDVGISSGVTTLELLERLDRTGASVSGVGVDICVRGYLTSCLGVDVLYDSHGSVLQVATPLFARGRPHHTLRSLPNRLLRAGISALETRIVRRTLFRSSRGRPIDLVTSRLGSRDRFAVVEHDIAVPRPEWSAAFNLIRVANVFNLDYFTREVIHDMTRTLLTYLQPGGLLVLARTRGDGTNHGSIYRGDGSPARLHRIRQFGDGHDLDSLFETL